MEYIEKVAVKKGYSVTEDGLLLNPKGKVRGKCISNRGYYQITLRIKKVNYKTYTHRLQAYQKYGDKLFGEGVMVRHLDGDPLNNSWDNIVIGNNSQNQMDIPKQVRIKRAVHATSYVRKYDKEEVKSFHNIDKSYKKTMENFNISSKGT